MVFLLCILLAVLLPIPSPWDVVLVVVGALLEVVEVTVLRRWSKRLDKKLPAETGAEAMVGSTGEVVEPCRPDGTVRVNGELWEARCEEGADPGSSVRVERLDGLVLVVTAVAPGVAHLPARDAQTPLA